MRNWNRLCLGVSVICVLAATTVACSSSSSKPSPQNLAPSAGGTGAFGIVTVNGTQKLYLPQQTQNAAGHAVISVVNVGLAGNGSMGAPALIKDIDLGDDQVATASGGDSSIVIAVSTDNRSIRFIDPSSDTLVKTITLPDAYGASSFSGGGGYITGVAVDSAHNRAIISVYDGFQIIDLGAQALGAHIQAAPAENFGYDSTRGYIIAPFYECSGSTDAMGTALPFCNDYKTPDGKPITEGLNVIDLADNTVYTYQNPMADNPAATMGGEPDSASIDPLTGLAVIPSEGDGYQNIVDVSQAKFDKTAKAFTAPYKKMMGFGHEGVSIEPASHLGFWEGEHSSAVAVANVSAVNGGTTDYVSGQMPNRPDMTGFSTLGDPHGIAVTSGIQNGKPVGVLVSDDRKWVARIDLEGMNAAAHAAGGGDAMGTLDAYVTYLDARTSP